MLQRHPALRWLAPAAVVGIAALTATGIFRAGAADGHLPAMSPSALLSAVRAPAHPSDFAGTVVSRISLGLPELPTLGGSSDAATFASLLSGSHTLQVWYGGPRRQRIAVLGSTDETDVFHNGRELWEWQSSDRTATEVTAPSRENRQATAAGGLPQLLTPSGLVQASLAELGRTTKVTVHTGGEVAGRSTYELVLTPRTSATTIGSIRIDVDGATKVPLGVRVYARGKSGPAIDLSYSSINFGRLSSSTFRFSPPSGAAVRRVTMHPTDPGGLATMLVNGTGPVSRLPGASTLVAAGSGWTTVVGGQLQQHSPLKSVHGLARRAFQPVRGGFGRGRMVSTDLGSVLVTNDGRVYAGAVYPTALYAAAAK